METFKFLSLPGEVRNTIYGYVLKGSGTLTIQARRSFSEKACCGLRCLVPMLPEGRRPFTGIQEINSEASAVACKCPVASLFSARVDEGEAMPQTALLRTCRLVHAEASRMIYSLNAFDFYPKSILGSFIYPQLPGITIRERTTNRDPGSTKRNYNPGNRKGVSVPPAAIALGFLKASEAAGGQIKSLSLYIVPSDVDRFQPALLKYVATSMKLENLSLEFLGFEMASRLPRINAYPRSFWLQRQISALRDVLEIRDLKRLNIQTSSLELEGIPLAEVKFQAGLVSLLRTSMLRSADTRLLTEGINLRLVVRDSSETHPRMWCLTVSENSSPFRFRDWDSDSPGTVYEFQLGRLPGEPRLAITKVWLARISLCQDIAADTRSEISGGRDPAPHPVSGRRSTMKSRPRSIRYWRVDSEEFAHASWPDALEEFKPASWSEMLDPFTRNPKDDGTEEDLIPYFLLTHDIGDSDW